MSREKQVEIISVGNEILIGKILNTNAHFLAKRATRLGTKVTRMTVVSDNVEEIAKAILESVERKPRFILITGGLGPTFDDKTLEGLAKALGRKLVVNPKAQAMVKEKYETYSHKKQEKPLKLTPPRVKMATIPEKTKPIRNPVGTAPAVVASINRTAVIVLPGVPREMEAIFEETIAPLLNQTSKGLAFHEDSLCVGEIMESALAPLIDVVMHQIPDVYIKSHPKGTEIEPYIEIHFSITTTNTEQAQEKLKEAKDQLSHLVNENGGNVSAT